MSNRIFALSAALLLAACSAQAAISPLELPPLVEGPNNRAAIPDAEVTYRLPNNTRPISYNVDISTNVHLPEFNFTGCVQIRLVAVEDTTTIVLHQRQTKDIGATLTEAGGAVHPVKSEYDSVTEFLTFTPTDGFTLRRGQEYVLAINYTGTLREDNGGFYRSSYTSASGATVYLATTQFESTDARHAFPCYDEPAIKAIFNITIRHYAAYTAVSNMPVDRDRSTPGVTVFQSTPVMSSYLVAFIVSDFVSSPGSLNGLPQRVFSRPGTEQAQEFALVSGMQIINKLAEYFKIDFSLPKLDQFAIPDFAAGAMENWGIATYREEYSLCDGDKCSTASKHNIANIIGHEYAHQWFGNLVAIQWWSYLWLKESFATLFSYKSVDEVHPEWDVNQLFLTNEYQRALNADGGSSPRPMTYYVETPRQISSLYDSVSYSKGGSVLKMFEHAFGADVFRQGLSNYLKNRQFNSGRDIDLFDAIATAAKELNKPMAATPTDLMSTWTNQGGYPLLNITRNYIDGTFVVCQEPFYNDQHATKDNRSWHIPYNFCSKSTGNCVDTTPHAWLLEDKCVKVTPKPDSQVAKADWLLLNKQSTGYYRVNYDQENWALLIAALKEKHYKIHTLNRASLIYDAYRFSVSERLSHETFLDLTTYLIDEEEYAPWSSAFSVLTTLNRYMSGVPDEYDDFKTYVYMLTSNVYEKLGTDNVFNEPHLNKFTRTLAINLICMTGDYICLADSNSKLRANLIASTPLDPNLESTIYCNGLKTATDLQSTLVFRRLMNSQDQAQRRQLISSIGCDQQERHLERFVNSSISTSSDNTLRVQERTTILNSAYARGEAGLFAAIDFLEVNYVAYANLTAGFGGGSPLDSDVRNMANYVYNAEQEARLLKLVDTIKAHPGVGANLEESVKRSIKSNFDWLDNNKAPIAKWILIYTKSGAGQLVASILPILGALVFSSRLLA